MLRTIVHLDADAFFASVEQAADPRLRGKPMAVGGEKRGIIASASYEARKLCPKLILLPGDFEKYERFSRWMFSYAQDFTPDVEIASIDEGYFDLSAVRKPPVAVADTIRNAIHQSLKISVSEGIASNKLVSQIASKLRKPAAFTHVPAGTEISFLHPLPNCWLPGVGPQMGQRLSAAGLACIHHVAGTPLDLLQMLAGKLAFSLRSYANGIDDRPVLPMSAPAKSYSQQQTFAADLTDEEFAEAVLRRMADELMAKVRGENKSIRTLTVKVRYNDMAEDQCAESLLEPTDLEADLYCRIHLLFRQAWKRRVSLRMVSLKFSNVYDGFCRLELPLQRSAQEHEARRRLAGSVDGLRRAHGSEIVMRGHDLRLREPPLQSGLFTAHAPVAASRKSAAKVLLNTDAALSPDAATKPGNRPRIWQRNRDPSPAPPLVIRDAPFLKRKPFVPLAMHSYYSFLNSTLSIEAIVGLARAHELPAIALVDEGNLHGAVQFTQVARAGGIKPIIGAEIQIEGSVLRLYVENAQGYANLCRLLSRAAGIPKGFDHSAQGWSEATTLGTPSKVSPTPTGLHQIRDGVPWQAFVEKSEIRNPKSEIDQSLLTSATTGLKDAQTHFTQLDGLTDGLLAVTNDARFAPLFPDRFYFDTANAQTNRTPVPPNCPRIALAPAHYAQREDRWKFDVVQSIRTRTLLRQAHPEKILDGEFHFRSPTEMDSLFGAEPELLAHTLELAERCAFELALGAPQFPSFVSPDGSPPRAFLRKLVLEGLRRRYRGRFLQVQPQVEQELGIIAEVGYEEYFLVVWDILQACRQRGIDWITRGSAADSLVCYCLGISDVCPIRFDLDFRRFLNKERMQLNKLPDIDVDFAHDRKDDVVDLIFEKYGADHTAVVGGFSK